MKIHQPRAGHITDSISLEIDDERLIEPLRGYNQNIADEYVDNRKRLYPSVPDAVAAARRYFMSGGTKPAVIKQDYLIYTITTSSDWDGVSLP